MSNDNWLISLRVNRLEEGSFVSARDINLRAIVHGYHSPVAFVVALDKFKVDDVRVVDAAKAKWNKQRFKLFERARYQYLPLVTHKKMGVVNIGLQAHNLADAYKLQPV